LRKVGAGELEHPVVRIEASQKGAKSVHLQDLATSIDKQGRRYLGKPKRFAGS
jgi:hypothetical protein